MLIVISLLVGVLDELKIDNSHDISIRSSVDQLITLWKFLGDDDPDRIFRLGVLESEADRVFRLNGLEGEAVLVYKEARKETWLIAVLENLQDPRKLGRFGYSLQYEKPKDWEDKPLEMAGEYVMVPIPNFALGELLSRPDGDPTLVHSAKQYYGHSNKEPTPSRRLARIQITESTLGRLDVASATRKQPCCQPINVLSGNDDDLSWLSDLAICDPFRIV